MIRRSFLKVLALAGIAIASPALAQDIDPENVLVLEISGEAEGIVEILLRPDVAPLHVAQIKTLVREGTYNGVAFHRVIEGFMAQTGDVEFGMFEGYEGGKAGRGGSTLNDLPAEFSDLAFDAGVVGMARSSNPDSANSQFFIMFERAASLDGQYTVFGRVIEGMDVVNAIKQGSRGANGAVADTPDYIASAYIKADGASE
ncbi:MAG: peptidylprolyl isomerase [Rhodobacteraceae bacterium]|nr:peptidylprolyl isomerase [Paracoccaceae bacterium]